MKRLFLVIAVAVAVVAVAGPAAAGDYWPPRRGHYEYVPGHYDRHRGHYDYDAGRYQYDRGRHDYYPHAAPGRYETPAYDHRPGHSAPRYYRPGSR